MGLNITVASKFNPFTYDDYIKPYKDNIETYFKNYRDTENKISDLGTQVEALEYIIESEPEDSPLKSIYSNYKKELEKAVEALMSGWSQADVQNYHKLKNMFAKDISPIAIQYTRRQKLEDEQRKIKESKPSTYFSKRAAETSLAEMIDNPNWTYTSFVGNDITKAVQDMVSPVATILDKIFKDGDLEGYSILKSQYGITPEDVVQYYNDENGKLKEFFDKVKETVVKSYEIDTWNDQNALNTAYNYANMGIPKAIGKITPQLIAPKTDKTDGDPKKNPQSEKPSVTLRSLGTIQDQEKQDQADPMEKNWRSIAGTDGKSGTGVTVKANEYRAALAKEGINDFSVKNIEYLASGAENKSKPGAATPTGWSAMDIDIKGSRIQRLAANLLAEYKKGQDMRSSVVYVVTNSDGSKEEIGLYGPTIVQSMNTKLAYDKYRSGTNYTGYEPTFEASTKKDILNRWAREGAYPEVSMYRLDNEGSQEKLNDEDKKSLLSSIMTESGNIKDNVGLILSPKNGIEIEYNGSRYIIDNYSSTDLKAYSDLMTKTYEELYDFDVETLRKYLDNQGTYNFLGADDITSDGKLSKTGFDFLTKGELWESKEGSNFKHAFVYVGDELVKIVAHKSNGSIVGIIPISSTYGNYQNSGPGLVMYNLASEIARNWHPRTVNKDLTTPPRGK